MLDSNSIDFLKSVFADDIEFFEGNFGIEAGLFISSDSIYCTVFFTSYLLDHNKFRFYNGSNCVAVMERR